MIQASYANLRQLSLVGKSHMLSKENSVCKQNWYVLPCIFEWTRPLCFERPFYSILKCLWAKWLVRPTLDHVSVNDLNPASGRIQLLTVSWCFIAQSLPLSPPSFCRYDCNNVETFKTMSSSLQHSMYIPVNILRKSISGRHRPVRVADGPMTARCRFT